MISKLLYEAFNLPSVGNPEPVPAGTICSLSGDPIGLEGALPRDFILTTATSAPHEQYRAPSEPLISAYSAACYQASSRSGYGLCGNLLATESAGLRPMVSAESAAASGRVTWQSLIYGTAPGLEAVPSVAVFSDEARRRLWLDARVSIPGRVWLPYLCWSSPVGQVSRTLRIDMEYLQQVLALCEHVYFLGFSKPAIMQGLFHSGYETLSTAGMARARVLDAALAPHRGTDEMLLAAFIVQRTKPAESPAPYQCLIPSDSLTNQITPPQTYSATPSTPAPAKSKTPSDPTLFD